MLVAVVVAVDIYRSPVDMFSSLACKYYMVPLKCVSARAHRLTLYAIPRLLRRNMFPKKTNATRHLVPVKRFVF